MAILDWLLDSDPAVRWQVLQDLADADAVVVSAERERVSTEGGARNSWRDATRTASERAAPASASTRTPKLFMM